MISLQLAFYAGIVLSFPFLLYFLAEFVLPALTSKERRILLPAIVAGFVLFGAGAVISYYVLPTTLSWFSAYAKGMGMDPRWQAREFCWICDPFNDCLRAVVRVAGGSLGACGAAVLVTFPMLSKTRPYAITAILVLVTPLFRDARPLYVCGIGAARGGDLRDLHLDRLVYGPAQSPLKRRRESAQLELRLTRTKERK
jgi:sec-independent protein translocase protein TatC